MCVRFNDPAHMNYVREIVQGTPNTVKLISCESYAKGGGGGGKKATPSMCERET